MEYPITEILDDTQDLAPELRSNDRASNRRVRELTLQKVHGCSRERKPAVAIRWAALAAAVLLCLSVTVLVASEHFARAPEGETEPTVGYHNDRYIGSNSKNWEIAGWCMELKAESCNAAGMTLRCEEWGSSGSGSLQGQGTFFLEMWNGDAYALYPASGETDAPLHGTLIQAAGVQSWQISWLDSHGQLPPGDYRLGQTFRYTAPNGEQQDAVCYAKFRVFSDAEAAPVNTYKTALQTLYEQETRHLTWQVFPEASDGYASYTQHLWKHGGNYLDAICYLDEEGNLLESKGSALLEGAGFRLSWEEGDPDGPVSTRTADGTVTESLYGVWFAFLELSDARITYASRDGNTLTFTETKNDLAAWETELDLTPDGRVQSIRQYRFAGAERILYSVLTVLDTPEEEISSRMTAQLP